MVEKAMTRRQFNKLLTAGMLISTEGFINIGLAASSLPKHSDIGDLGSYSAKSLIKAIRIKKISATELLKYFMDRHEPGFDSHRLTTIRIRIDINKIQNEPNLA